MPFDKPSPVSNSLQVFFTAKEAAAQERRKDDAHYWEQWMDNGQKPEHLEPLMQRFQPMLNQATAKWRAPAVQKTAFEAELKKHLIKAFESYDPNRGTALATHVMNRLPKVQRYNARYQNLASVSEESAGQVGSVMKAQSALQEEFGREPTRDEIADHLGMSPKKLDRAMAAMRKDISASIFESDPIKTPSSREMEVLDLLPGSLSAPELEIFQHMYGRDGKPTITSTSALAQHLKKAPSQVSRIKTSILGKIKTHLGL